MISIHTDWLTVEFCQDELAGVAFFVIFVIAMYIWYSLAKDA